MSITSKCDDCGRTVVEVPGKMLVECSTVKMARKHLCFDCIKERTVDGEES